MSSRPMRAAALPQSCFGSAVVGSTSSSPSRSISLRARRHSRLAINSVSSDAQGLSELFVDDRGSSSAGKSRYIFCGGKGGVGKTTTASAIGVKLAEQGHTTLVVSTDPAHSLGDALDEDLSGGGIVDVGSVMGLPLYAMEVDSKQTLDRFSEAVSGLDLVGLAVEAGISVETLETFQVKDLLKDLSSLFENPPPGIDEIVAIAQVLKLVKSSSVENVAKGHGPITRIVFDTAPTGHTLRLLNLPTFLDSFIAKAIKLRARVGNVLTSLSQFLGMENTFESKLNKVVSKLEDFQNDMQQLKSLLTNPKATEFVVVTIPTTMAVRESRRLLDSLDEADIATKHIVVNRILSPQLDVSYLNSIQEAQQECLERLQNLESKGIEITKVPYFDREVYGIDGLAHMGTVAFSQGNSNWEDITQGLPQSSSSSSSSSSSELSIEAKLAKMEMDIERQSDDYEPKFTIMGGKGGVGKTSSSASLAVHLAKNYGFKVAIVSTDPAHSLGDSLRYPLDGELRNVPGVDGLYAMEVDTQDALDQLRTAVKDMVQSTKENGGGSGGFDLVGQLKLEEFVETLETPPPGADELVALAQMLKIIKKGTPDDGSPFDHVIVDTAPTGHTLRLLSLPSFLDKFFERLKKVRDKVSGASTLLSMFSSSSSSSSSSTYDEPEVIEKVDRLQNLQNSIQKVTDLLSNKDKTQFCIVTIPTVLAVAETERLVASLQEQHIQVKHVIANQVVTSSEESKSAYLSSISEEQQGMMGEIQNLADAKGLNVVKVPYFDAEVRSVFGLKILGDVLFPPVPAATTK